MKRIGILTFHQVANYGAVLQCYALRRVLQENGYKGEVIPHVCKKLEQNEKLLRLNKDFPVQFIKWVSQLNGTRKKRREFDLFLKEHCGMNVIKSNAEFSKYDTVIVGSDQVWNLRLTDKDYVYLLEGVDNVNKIAYAASFGEEQVPIEEVNRLAKNVRDFDYVSVRENAGKQFLLDQGLESQLVCDPVLLLKVNNWIELAKSIDFKEKEPYVLVYCIEKSTEVFNLAKKIAKEKGCKVIYLNQNMLFKEKGLEYRRGVGPITFLQYLYHAEYVVTNSFHGTSFSIMFEKQFATDLLWHGKKNVRVNQLLEMTQLTHRTIQNIKLDDDKALYTPIKYDTAKEKLSEIRMNSKEFLLQALERME